MPFSWGTGRKQIFKSPLLPSYRHHVPPNPPRVRTPTLRHFSSPGVDLGNVPEMISSLLGHSFRDRLLLRSAQRLRTGPGALRGALRRRKRVAGFQTGRSEGSRSLQRPPEGWGAPRCIPALRGRRGWRRGAVPLRPQRRLSQRRGVQWGRCVMGKSPAEPHTFSRFPNFGARRAGGKPLCRGGDRAAGWRLLRARGLPACAGRLASPAKWGADGGRRAAGGQVAPGRRARA